MNKTYLIYRMRIRKELQKLPIEMVKINKEESQKEIERRQKNKNK